MTATQVTTVEKEVTVSDHLPHPDGAASIAEIRLPDLWHVAMRADDKHVRPYSDGRAMTDQDAILEVWHKAHALLAHIQEQL